jgi:hypothetical protein
MGDDQSMWLRLLEPLSPPLLAVFEPEQARDLEVTAALLRRSGQLQAEPAENAEQLLRVSGEFLDSKVVQRAADKLQGGAQLGIADWLLFSYLAAFVELLSSGWDGFYDPIFSAYPQLGQRMTEAFRMARSVPYEDGLARLEADWRTPTEDPRFDAAAVAFIGACTSIRKYGTIPLYERVSSLLVLDGEFLVVYLAAACLRLPGASDRVDIATWDDTQYACLSLLDNFKDLPGSSWG